MSFAQSERATLARLLQELGPDAPTCCEGWKTRDLAAHLWVRENKPLAAAGMFVPALAKQTEKEMDAARARDYAELVAEWGRGPQGRGARLRSLADAPFNLVEHFVHVEDLRRIDPQAQPREFSQAVQEQLWRAARRLAPLILRGNEVPVVLHPAGFGRLVVEGKHKVAAQGQHVVTVSGKPSEILLWLYNRRAQVAIDGLPCPAGPDGEASGTDATVVRRPI